MATHFKLCEGGLSVGPALDCAYDNSFVVIIVLLCSMQALEKAQAQLNLLTAEGSVLRATIAEQKPQLVRVKDDIVRAQAQKVNLALNFHYISRSQRSFKFFVDIHLARYLHRIVFHR